MDIYGRDPGRGRRATITFANIAEEMIDLVLQTRHYPPRVISHRIVHGEDLLLGSVTTYALGALPGAPAQSRGAPEEFKTLS
jgi:hypothetical protein